MDTVDWLYVCLIVTIIIFLGGLSLFAYKREARKAREANQLLERQLVSLNDEEGFEQPIWRGTIQAIIADEERHEAEMDLLVYRDSVCIGFMEQGFSFITLPAVQIVRVIGYRDSVRIQFRREDGRVIYYQLLGKQLKGATERIEFIRKRAPIR